MSEKIAPIGFFLMMIPFALLIYFLIHSGMMIGIYILAAIWAPCGWLARYISYKMDRNIEIDFKLFLVMLFGGAMFLLWMILFVIIPIKYNEGVDYYASHKGPL
jgi:hypothetical protein